jgi:membrane protease YdiL (CAAX protease family)
MIRVKEYRYGSLLKAEPYSVKEAVLLCLFVLGAEFPAGFIFIYLFPELELVFRVFSLGLALMIAGRRGKGFLRRLLKFRPLEPPVFFSLLIMYLGFEIITQELTNLFRLLLPVPEGFFGSGGSDNAALTILNGAVFPALSEEILFRGLILNRLRVKQGERKAVLISSLLFGLIHLNPWQFVNAAIGGIFYGWVYVRYRNLWLTVFLHFYYNVMVYFMTVPYRVLSTRSGSVSVMNPLWLDLLGLSLFALGLGLFRGISRGQAAERNIA